MVPAVPYKATVMALESRKETGFSFSEFFFDFLAVFGVASLAGASDSLADGSNRRLEFSDVSEHDGEMVAELCS